jgi:hypothetical protein
MCKAALQLLQQPLQEIVLRLAGNHAAHNAVPAGVLQREALPALCCYCCSLLLYDGAISAAAVAMQSEQ